MGTTNDYSKLIDFSKIEGSFKAAPEADALKSALSDIQIGV